jgi:hypothetical protein
VYVPDAERHALQRLTRQRERLEEELNSIKRRLLDLVRWACPAIEAALPDFRTNLSLAVLHDLFDPACVIKMRRAALRGFVAKHASGNHPHSGPFAERLIDDLKAALPRPIVYTGRQSTSGICSLSWLSRSTACVCWKPRSANSAARSRCSTTSSIPPMP